MRQVFNELVLNLNVMGDFSKKYFNRDLSWLSFNNRVLDEAADPSNPLYERIKFLAIYSNNLDEFFRVRVAHINSLKKLDKDKINKKLDIDPVNLVNKIQSIVHEQQERFGLIFREQVLKELKKNNIELLYGEEFVDYIAGKSKYFFLTEIMAFLNPQRLNDDPPFLENGKLYFFVELKSNDQVHHAIVNIPSDKTSRFVKLENDETIQYAFLDDIIKSNLGFVFPDHHLISCFSVKLNRDADLQIEDEYAGDMLDKIKKHLHKRQVGPPSRLLFDAEMPDELIGWIKKHWDLSDGELARGGRYHNFNDFFDFPNPHKPNLELQPIKGLRIAEIDNATSFFNLIDKQDVMLSFPYHSYDYVLRFFNEAAISPDVKEISLTIYRIARNSKIGHALINAAKNGKKVTCFVELKARFDEENNISWASEMEKAGVRIIYSMPGLKVHAKVALVRRKREGKNKFYAYFGTGNFNEKTASIYTDLGLFTADPALSEELHSVLNYLVTKKEKPKLNSLLVAQFNIVDAFQKLIEKEIANALEGKKSKITIKLNNLENKKMIYKLYEASAAGVQVELIIRGICCLRPGVKGLSENIRITRIVDSFLEHSRVFVFWNDGHPLYFSGSADWMTRNLYNRIEVVFPILDKSIQNQINAIMNIQLSDNVKASRLSEELENIRVDSDGKRVVRSQYETYEFLKMQPALLI